jgi:hypothetical protein
MGLSSAFAQVQAPNRLLSNSEDWKDVYSVMMYGNFIGVPSSFLVSDKHATLILNQIPAEQQVLAISSENTPFVVGYRALLRSKGYDADELTFENVNLELARRLTDINSFIVLDDSYGYNAIAVAPYAAVTRSYVLFADSSTIRDVDRFLSSKNLDNLIIYGNVDREVKNALEKYSPETINKDGDRFLNNIEIVKKYQEIRHAKQAVLTNGEFVEQEIMSGTEPVIFIGTNNVPRAIQDYVKNSEIEVGVLIGNELVGTATTIRRQMGISVFVKFAQGSRSPQGAISQVEALDMFYLPTYTLNLEIQSIKYNKATNKLEVALKNTEAQAVYAIGTYSLTGAEDSRQTVGDIGANFIDGNEVKTFTYDVETMPDGRITVDVFIIYGESQGSLEKEIRTTLEVETVRVLDECNIQINDISFTPRSRNFYINIENIGQVECFVDAELVDIIIAGERRTVSLDEIAQVAPGKARAIRIKVEDMEEEDLVDNEKIKVRALYGERENSLVKVLEGQFDLAVGGSGYWSWALWTIIIILIIFIFWKRRKNRKEYEERKKSMAKPAVAAHTSPHASQTAPKPDSAPVHKAAPGHAQQPVKK